MTYNNVSNFWWKSDSKKLYENIFQYLDFINKRQHFRQANNLHHMRLYSNFEMLGFNPYQHAYSSTPETIKNRLTLNIIQNMCDTVQSKITKNTPRPRFLTSDGNWTLKSRAKKLTKFIDGQFSMLKIPAKGAQSFLDATIFGTGLIKFYIEDGQIKAERVFTDEIKIDDAEALYGSPRQMHQVKYIHKDVIKEMFPKFTSSVDNIEDEHNHYNYAAQVSDMIEVVESWHLRSGSNASDGKHVISIRNATLFEEEYKKDYFPFVIFRWGLRPLGYFGQGLSEQLQGIQMEINKILRTIQVSMHLTSIPKVFVEASSKVVSSHINNEIGGIIKYVGTKPFVESFGGIPPELFSHLDRLYTRGFEIAGISQLSAQSIKPTGLDSGKALREFNDIESERFLAVGKRYEDAFLDAARIIIDLARDLYTQNKDLTVNVKGKKFLETIKWSDIDLKDDQYIMEVFPVSALSNTPSARMADVQELMASQIINPSDGRRLLAFPDLEAFNNLEDAAQDNIDKTIELIVEKGQYNPPEPYQNLQLGISKMHESYLMNKNDNLEEKKLDMMRRWIEQAKSLIDRAIQEEQQKAAAIQGAQEGAAIQAQEQQRMEAEQAKAIEKEMQKGTANPEGMPPKDILLSGQIDNL